MERIISAERVEDILNVFGSFDQNLHIIENEWNVHVTDRDAELKSPASRRTSSARKRRCRAC